MKPPSPSLSSHSTPAEITYNKSSSGNIGRLSSRAVAELENDITRREGLARREKRARVEAGLDSPESVLDFQVIGYPHSPVVRDHGKKELEAGDYWQELERERQRGKQRNEKRMLNLVARVPKAPPMAAHQQQRRGAGSTQGWLLSSEHPQDQKLSKSKNSHVPSSPKVYRSASTPAFLGGKRSALSLRKQCNKEDDFDIQLDEIVSLEAALWPVASGQSGRDSYQPCSTYRPSVLPCADPPLAISSDKADVQRLEDSSSERQETAVVSSPLRRDAAASRALFPEGSAKKAPRDDVSQKKSKGTASNTSIIAHYIQTRSNASYDSPISNIEVLDRYSAVPAIHLAHASALASPPVVGTPTSKTSFFSATPPRRTSPPEKKASPPAGPAESSQRARFFSQLAANGSQLKLSFPPSPTSIPSSRTSPTVMLGSPLAATGNASPLGSYRFGKDFSTSPSEPTFVGKGNGAVPVSAGGAGSRQSDLGRRRSSGFHGDDSGLEHREDSGTATSSDIPTPLNSRFSVESSVLDGGTSEEEEAAGRMK